MSRPRRPGASTYSFMENVRADLECFASAESKRVTWRLTLRMIFLMNGFQFVLARRIQDGLYTVPVLGRLFGRVWWWWTCRSFGCELAIGAPVGKGLYVPHPTGIIIGECTIGDYVTILQNVTIGHRSADVMGDPRIADRVYLAAGAVILGDVAIGRGATVGANSVVLKDVPEGALAVGSPARIITRAPGASEAPVGVAADIPSI